MDGRSAESVRFPPDSDTASPPRAFTTTFPSPARAMMRMKRIAIVAAVPATVPMSSYGDLRQRFPAAADARRQHQKILHRPGQTNADDDPEQPRHIPELRRQHRPNQRPRPADRGEVMAEQHPLVGRVIILPIRLRIAGVGRESSSAATFAARNAL